MHFENFRQYGANIGRHLWIFLKWCLVSIGIGFGVGCIGALFAICMDLATKTREQNDFLLYFLPFAGLVIVFLYRITHSDHDRGTNQVLATIHAESELPVKMAPLIFVSTILTHLFGGSSGREGAALQIGGSIGNQVGRLLRFDDNDRRVATMCAMSAAFSAVFGTPVAAAFFSMEVVSVGIMYYAALVPCVFSSLIAHFCAQLFSVPHTSLSILSVPDFSFFSFSMITLLAVLCAVLSILFCLALDGGNRLFRKFLTNPYIRIFTGGVLIIALTLLCGSRDYLGAGMEQIATAVGGQAVPFAFLLKILFTVITISCGFKGGEIVPSFFIGATFGCSFGLLFGFSPSLCAAVGMISVFCGVTNCPVSSLLIAAELFGFSSVFYFLPAIAVSYMLSGYYGLYHDQTIVYSKFKTKFINKKAGE